MAYLYHGYVTNNQRVIGFFPQLGEHQETSPGTGRCLQPADPTSWDALGRMVGGGVVAMA